MTLDRSPVLCFKRLIYRYLLETGYAPGDLPGGPYFVQEPLYGSSFRQEDFFMFSLYVSQCKNVSIT